MKRTLAALVGSAVVMLALIVILVRSQSSIPGGGSQDGFDGVPLVLYCAASNRAVVDEICRQYTQETGRTVEIQYGASQVLLSSIEVSGTGDLFLPADDSYLAIASEKGLTAEIVPIAKMQAVVAVPKGNPKSIESFQDLFRDDVRFLQASPEATAIGKVVRDVLSQQDQWKKLDQATAAYRTTVTEVANDVLVNATDAGIVYDAVLHTYPDLQFVRVPELDAAVSQVSIGVLDSTQQSQAALHFARYLSARDRGLIDYAEHGFQVDGGDKWAEVPELNFFAGSMLRPAIEQTIAEFEQREGVRVNTVYNGCGILVAQMKAGQRPDAYFACDSEFMQQVPDLFPTPFDVSQNELVIIVQKGNPHGIATLRDLANEGLRVGIGHEKQCAMGWLTQNTLREAGIQQEVMANVTVQTPTGDMLVNQLMTGSLDAAVVYLSNAAGAGEAIDAIQIQGLNCSIATQPLAVAPDCEHGRTASRLVERICSVESKQSFVAEGFRWRLATDKENGKD